MERNGGISKLRAHEADLRRLGVERLFLFGSTARSETRKDSDVDLFQMNVKDLARRILDRSTDIMTRASLHPVLRKRIEATAFRVF